MARDGGVFSYGIIGHASANTGQLWLARKV
jgi:hypothetical protein